MSVGNRSKKALISSCPSTLTDSPDINKLKMRKDILFKKLGQKHMKANSHTLSKQKVGGGKLNEKTPVHVSLLLIYVIFVLEPNNNAEKERKDSCY